MAWERRLGAAGWIGLGWPESDGGRGLPWRHQVIFYEEYAQGGRSGARRPHRRAAPRPDAADVRHGAAEGPVPARHPGRHGAVVPGLLRTRRRVRPGGGRPPAPRWTAASGTCTVRRCGRRWPSSRTGASCWRAPTRRPSATADCPTCSCRCASRASRSGRSCSSPAPSEFNEVFFDDARAAAGDIVGAPGDGWRVAMGTLGVERGVSTFGQQMGFQREFEAVLAAARANGRIDDPDFERADRRSVGRPAGHALHSTWPRSDGRPPTCPGTEANIIKLLWAPWHQRLGELAVDVAGPEATVARTGLRPDRRAAALPATPGPTPSTAARTRSSATSSPSAGSACHGSRADGVHRLG